MPLAIPSLFRDSWQEGVLEGPEPRFAPLSYQDDDWGVEKGFRDVKKILGSAEHFGIRLAILNFSF